ncbi:hypothetical protein ABW19_dt0200064 [Dactylella cylindrospora]|nr:hypothetical protein ABW19_dt0200064 [Dactylella cylindrospora]
MQHAVSLVLVFYVFPFLGVLLLVLSFYFAFLFSSTSCVIKFSYFSSSSPNFIFLSIMTMCDKKLELVSFIKQNNQKLRCRYSVFIFAILNFFVDSRGIFKRKNFHSASAGYMQNTLKFPQEKGNRICRLTLLGLVLSTSPTSNQHIAPMIKPRNDAHYLNRVSDC